MAAASGLVVQWIHTMRERRNNIKEIQELLKSEFIDLYQGLMRERQVIKMARGVSKKNFNSFKERDVVMLDFLSNVGWLCLDVRVWDTIISSGNLIKLNPIDIKIIQIVQQRIRYHDKYIIQLEKDLMKQVEIKYSGGTYINVPNYANMRVVDLYLDNCEEVIEETIKQFKELDKMSWFDYDKIKDIGPNYKAHSSKILLQQDQTPMRSPTSGL